MAVIPRLAGQYVTLDGNGQVPLTDLPAQAVGVLPSSDPTGVTDAAAIMAAIGTLPPQGGVVTLSPTSPFYIKCGQVVIPQSGVYINAPGCYINAVGTGDVIRMYDNTNTWPVYGGGVLGDPVIDGTNAGAGSCGVHLGDLFRGVCDVAVQNFTGAGSIGVHFDNAHYWTEQLRTRIYAANCTSHVVFDVSGATTSTASFARLNADICINQANATFDGVVVQNGALPYDGQIGLRGNFVGSGSSLTSAAVRITGTVPAGHPGAGNAAKIADCRLDFGLECASNTHTPTTIIRGSNSNVITNCYGVLDFGGDASSANFAQAAAIGIIYPFMGPVKGDLTFQFGGQGLSPLGATYSATGGFALGDFSTATSISSSGTIGTGKALTRVTETGNVTGMILAAGSYDGQTFWLVNEANFTITFAASGTSHVADGASDVVPALSARMYVFEGNDTNLWYRCA